MAKTGSPLDRAYGYVGWSNLGTARLDYRDGLEKANLAVASDPDLPFAYQQRAAFEAGLGHQEAALSDLHIAATRMRKPGQYYNPDSGWDLPRLRRAQEIELGDYRAAANDDAVVVATRGTDIDRIQEADDLIEDHDLSQALRILRSTPDTNPKRYKDEARLSALIALEDWAGFARLLASLPKIPLRPTAFANYYPPGLAYGLARAGDVRGAAALISTTPLDCYGCVRERGDLAVATKDWPAAERWYAEAIRQAPSIPFAYNNWGAMLLHRGDYDAAIAKFEQAHEKGPRFADPLEMWGEALMQKNRSDLALAKFAEANEDAPRWGRLHLKWGQALWWTGNKEAARQQFSIASNLDLSAADKQTLARATRWH